MNKELWLLVIEQTHGCEAGDHKEWCLIETAESEEDIHEHVKAWIATGVGGDLGLDDLRIVQVGALLQPSVDSLKTEWPAVPGEETDAGD